MRAEGMASPTSKSGVRPIVPEAAARFHRRRTPPTGGDQPTRTKRKERSWIVDSRHCQCASLRGRCWSTGSARAQRRDVPESFDAPTPALLARSRASMSRPPPPRPLDASRTLCRAHGRRLSSGPGRCSTHLTALPFLARDGRFTSAPAPVGPTMRFVSSPTSASSGAFPSSTSRTRGSCSVRA